MTRAAAAAALLQKAAAGGETTRASPRRGRQDEREWQAMDRVMDSLAQFCIEQRHAFDAGAWLAKFEEEGDVVALAARYLSMTSWYGHEAELERVCAATHVAADSNGLHLESRAIGFDLHSFSVRVRLGLARARRAHGPRRVPAPVDEEREPHDS